MQQEEMPHAQPSQSAHQGIVNKMRASADSMEDADGVVFGDENDGEDSPSKPGVTIVDQQKQEGDDIND